MTLLVMGASMDPAFRWPGYVFIAGLGGFCSFRKSFGLHSISRVSLSYLSLLLLLIYCVVRQVGSEVIELGINDLIYIIVGIIIYILVSTQKDIPKSLVGLLCMLIFANALAAWFQKVVDPSYSVLSSLGYVRNMHLDRPSGLFLNANHSGAFSVTVLVFLAAQITFGGVLGKLKLSLFVMSGVLAVVCVALSESRGAFLAATIGFIFLVLMYLLTVSGRRSFRVGIAVFIVVCAIGVVTSVGLSNLDKQRRNADEAMIFQTIKNDPRIALWKSAIDQWKSAPIFGNDPGSFKYLELKYREPFAAHISETRGIYAHSDVLQILSEYGLCGLIFVLFAMGVHLTVGVNACSHKRSKKDLALVIGASASLVVLLTQSMVEFHLRTPALWVLLCIFLGVIGRYDSTLSNLRFNLNNMILRLCSAALLFLAATIGVADASVAIAEAELRTGSVLKARNLSRLGQRFMPISSRAIGVEGNCFLKLGNSSRTEVVKASFFLKAAEIYKRAREKNPYEIEFVLSLTRIYGRIGDLDSASKYWEIGLDLAPKHPAAHLAKIDALVYCGLFKEAINACEDWYRLTGKGVALQEKRRIEREVFKQNAKR